MCLPLLIYLKTVQGTHNIALERFYELAGISRQAVHQYKMVLGREQKMMGDIRKQVNAYRAQKDRRAGSRSLFYNLEIQSKYGLGVNKFEQLMSKYCLTLRPLRVRVVTTQSCLQSWNYPNLVNGLKLSDINELVVGDLTYVHVQKYQYYMFCLTDVYSARITGYSLGKRMRAEEAKIALDMWVALRGTEQIQGCIHHTDGGAQYFSALYLGAAKQLKIRTSVARNCLENGYAEQRNGLIKHHLIPTIQYQDVLHLTTELDRIIYVYNHERKQELLGWKTPVEYEEYIRTLENRPERKLHDWPE